MGRSGRGEVPAGKVPVFAAQKLHRAFRFIEGLVELVDIVWSCFAVEHQGLIQCPTSRHRRSLELLQQDHGGESIKLASIVIFAPCVVGVRIVKASYILRARVPHMDTQ